jgi:cytochrome c-type biogenesis protein CcmE
MKRYGKFAVLIVLVVGTLVWLATASMNESKTYYRTVSEVGQMGMAAEGKRLRVAGDVEDGSITRKGSQVDFVLVQDGQRLNVSYTGRDPLPDTFRGGAEALADGRLGPDGVFQATRIQAKCASKYEPKPGQQHPGEVPSYLNQKSGL